MLLFSWTTLTLYMKKKFCVSLQLSVMKQVEQSTQKIGNVFVPRPVNANYD